MDELARLRDALDRIARFAEAFTLAAGGRTPSGEFGAALVETLGNHARKALSETL